MVGEECTKKEDIPTIVEPGMKVLLIVAPETGTMRRRGEQAPGERRRDSLIQAVKNGRASNASKLGGELISGQTERISARREE